MASPRMFPTPRARPKALEYPKGPILRPPTCLHLPLAFHYFCCIPGHPVENIHIVGNGLDHSKNGETPIAMWRELLLLVLFLAEYWPYVIFFLLFNLVLLFLFIVEVFYSRVLAGFSFSLGIRKDAFGFKRREICICIP